MVPEINLLPKIERKQSSNLCPYFRRCVIWCPCIIFKHAVIFIKKGY